MEILAILFLCGIIFLFAHLYDKFFGDPLTFKKIEQHDPQYHINKYDLLTKLIAGSLIIKDQW